MNNIPQSSKQFSVFPFFDFEAIGTPWDTEQQSTFDSPSSTPVSPSQSMPPLSSDKSSFAPLWDVMNSTQLETVRKRPLSTVTGMALPPEQGSKFQRFLNTEGENLPATSAPYMGKLDSTTRILTLPGQRFWCYGSQQYEMLEKPLANGQFTQARGFIPGQKVTFEVLEKDGQVVQHTYDSESLVAKIVNPLIKHEISRSGDRGRKQQKFNAFSNIEAGYHYLMQLPEEDRIRVARMIASPTSLINPETGKADLQVYFVERAKEPAHSKMTQWGTVKSVEELPDAERVFLDWVKFYVTKIVVHGLKNNEELYNDFAPKNIMFDVNGYPELIDYSLPEKDWAMNLKKHLNDWAFRNPVIFDYLVDVGDCGKKDWDLGKHLTERFNEDPFRQPIEFNSYIPVYTPTTIAQSSSSSSMPIVNSL